MKKIKQVFKLKIIFLILLGVYFFSNCQKIHAHEVDGHHGPTYKITPPLKNKDLNSCIFLRVIDEKTKEPIPARFSLIINHKPYVPDSLDENGIRFTSIHTASDDLFTCTYTRGKGVVTIPLPEKTQNGIIYLTKGYEYIPSESHFTYEGKDTITIQMKRWINLEQEGWLSTDEHIHYDRLKKDFDEDWLTMLEADGVAHSHFLVLKGGNLPSLWASQYEYGKAGTVTNNRSAIFPGEEYRDSRQGHINLLGIDSLIYPILAGTKEYPYNYPTFHDIFIKTHELGGIGGTAHGAKLGKKPTGFLDVILGNVDFFEILNTGITKTDIWYRLMNCGYFIPPAAGTDLPNWPFRDTWQPFFGETRMYVKMEENKYDFESWKHSVENGKIFVTSGPIIKLEANNSEMGDIIKINGNNQVEINAELQCTQPIQSLEIILNGKVLLQNLNWKKKDNIYSIKIHETIQITESSWIAARGTGFHKCALYSRTGDMINVFAHTAPIQILVDNAPIMYKEDAVLVKNELEDQKKYYHSEGKYEEEKHRQRMMDLYDKAIDIINDRINGN